MERRLPRQAANMMIGFALLFIGLNLLKGQMESVGARELFTSIFPEAINLSSQSASVKSIAKAADLNGDGVIQWAEWYYAARAINRALVASGVKSSKSIDDEK